MKTKNQTGHPLLELKVLKAANEDGISTATRDSSVINRQMAWSPREVWRTRVKAPSKTTRSKPTPIQ
ncbi:MAG TPA: hypothetical protein VFL16_07925 [Steroidobacteraceae bacterium]|jgi:hypothetical protein|nr:hypothetical protein [Steroidobacteraceae bacterium]